MPFWDADAKNSLAHNISFIGAKEVESKMTGTPCERFAAVNGNNSMTHQIAAIGTDLDDTNNNLLEALMAHKEKSDVYPEFLAWWLLHGQSPPVGWDEEKNKRWVKEVIARGIPVLVAHNQATKWRANKGFKKTKWGTWMEAKMFLDAGYKWSVKDKFPTLVPPVKAASLTPAAVIIDEDLADALSHLEVSEVDTEKTTEKVQKAGGENSAEEDSDT